MKFINEIRRAHPPYKVKCIELGDMFSRIRIRVGFILTHKKLKWFNYVHTRFYSVSIKCFSMALLINDKAGK